MLRVAFFLIAAVLTLVPVGAQTCPQPLTPVWAGWVPPSLCAGLGRYGDDTQAEVQAARNLFQAKGYAAGMLQCWRTHLEAPEACLAASRAVYHHRQRENMGRQQFTPPCLADDLASDVNRDMLDALLTETVYPVLYCARTNTGWQVRISNALEGLFRRLGTVLLERAIDELSVEDALRREAAVFAQYVTAVDRADETLGPACLSPDAAIALGTTVRRWVTEHATLPFCAR